MEQEAILNLDDAKICCDKLQAMIEEEHPPMLLDLRSFLVYNQSHIKGAINICIPKTLAKRSGFTIKSVESGICKKGDKDLFRQRKDATLILYDQNGAEREPTGLLYKCFEVLVKEALALHVYWLEGGFLKFQNEFPDLARTARNTGTLLKPSPKMSRSLTMSAPGPMTAPADLSAHDEIIEITDYLYLGGSQTAENYNCLKEHQVRYIINTAVELRNCFSDQGDFTYARLDLQDHPSQQMCFVNVFEYAFSVIDEARRNGAKALVHCRGGRSRSATIVIGYLMKTNSWTLQQAYEYVQSKSPKISPNLGFMGQLMNFELLLRKNRDRAERYGEDGTVSGDLSRRNSAATVETSCPTEALQERPQTPQTLEAIRSISSVTLQT